MVDTEEIYEPAYTPWFLGAIEKWDDAKEIFAAPQKSSITKETPYLIAIGIFIAIIPIAALIMTRN